MNHYQQLKSTFEQQQNEQQAKGMCKYMRNLFPFYGIKAPLRKELVRGFIKENGKLEGEELKRFVECCWEAEHRELQYAAMDIMDRVKKKLTADFVPFVEKLILQKSWWDTVDWLAPNALGSIFSKHPELIRLNTDSWIASDNIWLQRSAILFQLKYKDQVDEALLFEYILRRADSKEFFVQKAAGWALRQYSKFNAQAVIHFIKNNEQLAPLTKKEGMKFLLKK